MTGLYRFGTGTKQDRQLWPTQIDYNFQHLRERLSANITYYVRTDGSDSNDGLSDSASGAFATWNKSVAVLATIDGGGFTATVRAGGSGSRTWTGGLTIAVPFVGFSVVQFLGDTSTPTNVVIGNGSTDAAGVTVSIPSGGAGQNTWVRGFQLKGGSNGNSISVTTGGQLLYGNIDFPAVSQFHINADRLAYVENAFGSCTVSGGAVGHYVATNNSINRDLVGVTFTADSAFTVFALASLLGNIQSVGAAFTLGGHSVTGQRYLSSLNGAIQTNAGGANFYPGDSAGSSTSGGIYQ